MNKAQIIKEMAKTLGGTWLCDLDGNPHGLNEVLMLCDIENIAEQLYDAGYRKQSEWISVKDRLPEKEEIVLCCLGLVHNVYTYKGDNIWEDSYGYYQKDEPITHWMYLPELPRGVKKNYERTK
jgi:hypothetical protein